jgi:hypothetical protein
MGMDFSALLHCRSGAHLDPDAPSAIQASLADSLQMIESLWLATYLRPFRSEIAHWGTHSEHLTQLESPKLPSYEVCFHLPPGFEITFGADAVMVYHRLRWSRFLVDQSWRVAMLDTVGLLAEVLQANDVSISHDCHPIFTAFLDSAPYLECLSQATGIEAERNSLDDLYEELPDGFWDSHGFWRMPGSN